MAKPTAAKTIDIDLEDDSKLSFEVKRNDYINFVNASVKNPFNAMHNLLVNSVSDDSEDDLKALLANPANVSELAGALIEQYKPDVAVAVKKRKNEPAK